jgi:hypothetical protein
MSDWKLPWSAGCRCERLRMTISAPPVVTMACHCTGCQRMSASAFSLSILVPASGFAITQGETEIGGLHGPSQHHHCSYCKTWAFTRPDGMDGFVNLRATMLDDHAWFSPFVETCRAEGFPWASTGAVHSFPNILPPEAFGPIVSQFLREGARPQASRPDERLRHDQP